MKISQHLLSCVQCCSDRWALPLLILFLCVKLFELWNKKGKMCLLSPFSPRYSDISIDNFPPNMQAYTFIVDFFYVGKYVFMHSTQKLVIIIIIRCQIWNRHWRPCLSKHLCHQSTSKNLNPYFVHPLPSYKDYQEMLFVVAFAFYFTS